MKEGWKRRGMRQYNRSEKPRFRWTEELHDRFLEAIRSLGGHERATPKQILLLMREKSMSISHVKSHLQTYRNTKNHVQFRCRPSDRNMGRERKIELERNSGRGVKSRRFLVEKFSNEWVPKMADFPILGSCGKSTGISQHKVREMDSLRGRARDDEDSCRLTLSTFLDCQSHDGFGRRRDVERISDGDTADDNSAHADRSDQIILHGHPIQGCINLELTIA